MIVYKKVIKKSKNFFVPNRSVSRKDINKYSVDKKNRLLVKKNFLLLRFLYYFLGSLEYYIKLYSSDLLKHFRKEDLNKDFLI
ncbi:hypothetical protein BpHYR1_010294 [Brachionus plicatilis]|uniref:Uncharacterized protein n=1 Tax=Brachionus plicatilis TaxID=10195 RepID=A0A3M7S2Z7_BRAPC|nr:hypothetical protein BpHYR1_010294 [Brachionus plicatilis]